VASPVARRAKMARRVGSARAENVSLSGSDIRTRVSCYLTYRLNTKPALACQAPLRQLPHLPVHLLAPGARASKNPMRE
jgi:hypothetical protein